MRKYSTLFVILISMSFAFVGYGKELSESCELDAELSQIEKFGACSGQYDLLACGALGAVSANRVVSKYYKEKIETYKSEILNNRKKEFLNANMARIEEIEKSTREKARNFSKDKATTKYILSNWDWIRDPEKRALERQKLIKEVAESPKGKTLYVQKDLIFAQHKLEALDFFEKGNIQFDKGYKTANYRLPMSAMEYDVNPEHTMKASVATKKEWVRFSEQWENRKKLFVSNFAKGELSPMQLRKKYGDLYTDIGYKKTSVAELAEKYQIPKSVVKEFSKNIQDQFLRTSRLAGTATAMASKAMLQSGKRLLLAGTPFAIFLFMGEGLAGSVIPGCGELGAMYIPLDRENSCEEIYEVNEKVLAFFELPREDRCRALQDPVVKGYFSKLHSKIFVEPKYNSLNCNGNRSFEFQMKVPNEEPKKIKVELRSDSSIQTVKSEPYQWNYTKENRLSSYESRTLSSSGKLYLRNSVAIEDINNAKSDIDLKAQMAALRFPLYLPELASCCSSKKVEESCKQFFNGPEKRKFGTPIHKAIK